MTHWLDLLKVVYTEFKCLSSIWVYIKLVATLSIISKYYASLTEYSLEKYDDVIIAFEIPDIFAEHNKGFLTKMSWFGLNLDLEIVFVFNKVQKFSLAVTSTPKAKENSGILTNRS